MQSLADILISAGLLTALLQAVDVFISGDTRRRLGELVVKLSAFLEKFSLKEAFSFVSHPITKAVASVVIGGFIIYTGYGMVADAWHSVGARYPWWGKLFILWMAFWVASAGFNCFSGMLGEDFWESLSQWLLEPESPYTFAGRYAILASGLLGYQILALFLLMISMVGIIKLMLSLSGDPMAMLSMPPVLTFIVGALAVFVFIPVTLAQALQCVFFPLFIAAVLCAVLDTMIRVASAVLGKVGKYGAGPLRALPPLITVAVIVIRWAIL